MSLKQSSTDYDASATDTGRRKLTFFCQACGYASPVDGEWRLETTSGGTVDYRCPDCDYLVYRRVPTVDSLDDE